MFIEISNYNKGVICDICNSNKTHIKIRKGKGSSVWYNYRNGKICQNCYNKLKKYPKYLNEKKKKYRLNFKNINMFLSFELPREKCIICDKTKDQVKIDRHHYFYIRIMPWACTISVCKHCHGKITIGNIIYPSLTASVNVK